MSPRPLPTLDALLAGIAARDRALLGRALTLVESHHPAHRALAEALLAALPSPSPPALRVGITGTPGAGKSTLIDSLGSTLTARGHHVAVLAVDPSSIRTGGSILGDKTRMTRLATDPHAFIRPSPSGGTLGGLAARTRESLRVLEGAGYDVLFIETVGVGQSETAVRHLSDTFVLLTLSGAGDELQGIKRGVMELADLLLVTKADGANVVPALRAATQLRSALRLLHPRDAAWSPPVLTVSALATPATPDPLRDAWDAILAHRHYLETSGELAHRRRDEARHWFWALVDEERAREARAHPTVQALERALDTGELTPSAAAQRLLAALPKLP